MSEFSPQELNRIKEERGLKPDQLAALQRAATTYKGKLSKEELLDTFRRRISWQSLGRKSRRQSEQPTICFQQVRSKILRWNKSIEGVSDMSIHKSRVNGKIKYLNGKDIYSKRAMQSQTVELEYNENTPPAHDLHIQTEPGLALSQLTSRKLNNDALSVKFDREGELLAVGCKNGTKFLYSMAESKFLGRVDDVKENSVTSMKWRPGGENKNKILAAADAGGHVTFMHVPSLKPLFTIQEQTNSLNTLDFSWSGKIFATGGKDFHVRLYDEDTKTVVHDFQPAGWNNVGHDNRVFAVKFIDENTLISGGWDSVVHIWDVRQARSAQHFYGPNISGESLDYENGTILAGCYAAQKQLQFWDIKSLKKVEEIDWTAGNIDDAEYIYASSFSKRNPELLAAGSTGPQSEVRLYRQAVNEGREHRLAGKLTGLSEGCFCLDFSSKNEYLCFGTPHHGLYIYEYKLSH